MKISIEIEPSASQQPEAKVRTYWIAINATPGNNKNFQNQEKT
jgi:hypothetical protein